MAVLKRKHQPTIYDTLGFVKAGKTRRETKLAELATANRSFHIACERCLAVGVPAHVIARVADVDKKTVLRWARELPEEARQEARRNLVYWQTAEGLAEIQEPPLESMATWRAGGSPSDAAGRVAESSPPETR